MRTPTSRGRTRGLVMAAQAASRPLHRTTDYGDPVALTAVDVGATGERWIEPFLVANDPSLRRLDLGVEVRVDPVPRVLLTPRARIGAVPLVSPGTRRVAAGLLVEPRFRWSSLGAVFSQTGFAVEPVLGGAPLVPGSAREVPAWLLAGPVIHRIAGLLRHRRRGFVETAATRSSPRGSIDWASWAGRHVAQGRPHHFPCRYSEPEDDPDLIARVRWALVRVRDELSTVAASAPGRHLLAWAAELLAEVGPGPASRPPVGWQPVAGSEWDRAGVEAISWVAEERGLGGARSLSGLAWDLRIDEVWEAWVAALAGELSHRLGLVPSPFGTAMRRLRWQGPVESMGALVPDVELRGADHVVWIDAKYKAHLDLLARRGWQGVSEGVQQEHRADLHQALAYASLADVARVDTVLLYPQIGERQEACPTVASVVSGRRCVRLILAAAPFGYRSAEHREGCLRQLRDALSAP